MDSKPREYLRELVRKAEELLKKDGKFYTGGDKLALLDMMEQAEKALAGENNMSHVRKREFYRPREDEAVQFAAGRYTMAPTYLGNSNFSTYGLEDAINWFRTRDMRGHLNKAEEILKRCQALAEEIISKKKQYRKGEDLSRRIGFYDREAVAVLENITRKFKEALQENENNSGVKSNMEELAEKLVSCLDALHDVYYSRVLRSEVNPGANIFVTEEELEAMKTAVKSDVIAKEQFRKIKEIADGTKLEKYIASYKKNFLPDDYTDLNDHYIDWKNKENKPVLWSSTGTAASFSVPKEGKSAVIRFLLPSKENEEEGLGHVWIDNVELLCSLGQNAEIKNAGFEEGQSDTPEYWKKIVRKGNPVFRWEESKPYCGRESKSIFLCNPTPQDEGAWEYEERFLVSDNAIYTLLFDCKADGKLKEGMKTQIVFYNEKEEITGEYEYIFNRKAWIPCESYNLSLQCDAIVYAMTGDKVYAEKTKIEILHMLNDFCQGAEHWLVTNERPEGSDAYGAVQGGRNLCSIAVSYSLIKNAGVFTAEEKGCFYGLVDYMLRYMLDYRDRLELSFEEAQRNTSNWQTDMCIGASMIMMVLDDFKNRKVWIYNAYAVLKGQLECNINQDSSWPESVRYHHAALERFASYARVLLLETRENWYTDTRLGEMFGYSLHIQTPSYCYFDNHISTPPFGDHALGNGKEFAIYGLYLEIIEKINKHLADKMYTTWKMAGYPVKNFWGESLALENLMYVRGYETDKDFAFNLNSTKNYKNAGIYIFRKDFGKEKQSYFAIMSSPKKVGHGHKDQGSFIIYKDSIPIVMDSGIEGYFDASTPWHLCSYSHACLQFATKKPFVKKAGGGFINLSAGTYSLERGFADVPDTSKVINCSLGKDIDSITIEIAGPEGEGIHIRNVVYDKGKDTYIITDTIRNFKGKVLWNLPVVSKSSIINGNTIYSKGYYGVDLETEILTPYESLMIDKGRTTPLYPSKDKIQMLEYIRIISDAGDGVKVTLKPV